MKFGKYVEDNSVPEWASKYLLYKQLKKKIKAIVVLNDPNISRDHEAVRAFEEAINSELVKITSFYLQKEAEASDFFLRLQKFTAPLLGVTKQIIVGEESHEQPLLEEDIELQDISLSSSSSLPPSSLPPSSDIHLRHSTSPLPLPEGSRRPSISSAFSPSYIFTLMRSRSGEIRKEEKSGEGDGEEETGPEKFSQFLQHKFLKGFHYSENLLGGISNALKLPKRTKENQEQHEKAKKRLAMAAALEYYRGLVLLKNYCIINYTGFIKILKKADKLTRFSFRKEILCHITAQPFHMSNEIDRLMTGTEKIFGTSFLSGDMRQAKRVLRVPDQKADPTRSFVVGILLGLNLCLASLLIYTVFMNTSPYDKTPKIIFPRYKDVYTMFSALGLPILWTWVFGLDILAWTRARILSLFPLSSSSFTHLLLPPLLLSSPLAVPHAHSSSLSDTCEYINYAFIFEMDPRWKLTHNHCFEAVNSLTLIWLIAVSLYVWTSAGTFPLPHPPPEYFPLILAAVFVFIVVCPLDIFYKQGRYWFLSTLGRIASAPFRTVKFKDFFIADQLTSLVLVMVQFQFLICFYSHDVHHSPHQEVCASKLQPYISPYLSALPASWRFLQSLRRFRDSKDRIHLLNAGKYSCTFFVVTFSTLDSYYGTHVWNVFRICWLVAATVNALYAYCWDIFMDWSILYYSKGKFSVRKKRVYPYSAFYIWAAITNLILRFAWSLTKSNLLQLANLVMWQLVVVVAAAEILRRGQWNLFRLENEHLNNCGKFRAVNEIQLPV